MQSVPLEDLPVLTVYFATVHNPAGYRRVAYARDFGNEHLYGDHGRGCGRPRA